MVIMMKDDRAVLVVTNGNDDDSMASDVKEDDDCEDVDEKLSCSHAFPPFAHIHAYNNDGDGEHDDSTVTTVMRSVAVMM